MLSPVTPITQEEYDFIRQFVYEKSRINLGPHKKELVMARLSKRLRALNLTTYKEYLTYLKDISHKEEITHLIDAISTNHTFFFRETIHFDFLTSVILPEFVKKAGGGMRTFRVWSAASSTGEEPYSIGIILSDYFLSHPHIQWALEGTDISTTALGAAKEGIFSEEKVKQLSSDIIDRYFKKCSETKEGFYQAKPPLRAKMNYRAQNLLKPPYPFHEPFDVIFCRNVMIYFDRQTQQELVSYLVPHLRSGGYLMIGHAESLAGISHTLKIVKPTIYRKE
ncbi:MAG: hypothetical protein A2007_05390 [Verrucomicrobia bacterium GWC2_42_7]|nr:MAG: hypothetical protein A2007_05390 [Verrucomicrobia bacterium GWC2_42_7]